MSVAYNYSVLPINNKLPAYMKLPEKQLDKNSNNHWNTDHVIIRAVNKSKGKCTTNRD